MTEKEWLTEKDPLVLLQHRNPDPFERRILLLVSACCSAWSDKLSDEGRSWIRLAEAVAEGRTSRNELELQREAGERLFCGLTVSASKPMSTAMGVVADLVFAAWLWPIGSPGRGCNSWDDERIVEARLVRDIFGNPFRPVEIDPRWLTSNVVDLSQAIYQERAFERMPILADALMDAGCDSEEIIHHCRGDGPHVRGCWVVDLLLGKE